MLFSFLDQSRKQWLSTCPGCVSVLDAEFYILDYLWEEKCWLRKKEEEEEEAGTKVLYNYPFYFTFKCCCPYEERDSQEPFLSHCDAITNWPNLLSKLLILLSQNWVLNTEKTLKNIIYTQKG